MEKQKPSYKDKHGISRLSAFLKGIGKSDILDKIIGVGGKLLTGNPLAALSELLKKEGNLSPEQISYAQEIFKQDLADVQNARDNETARDTSEHAPWLSKNIHEIIAISVISAWITSWFVITVTSSEIIASAATLVLGYLYGRTKPQA